MHSNEDEDSSREIGRQEKILETTNIIRII
jgi:hypothetical protein